MLQRVRSRSGLRLMFLAVSTLIGSTAPFSAKATELNWQPWSSKAFDQARAEGRMVILDLEAVWCHWCHVMEQTTYKDAKVSGILAGKFVTVRVDQDANPDLSNRYGDWGWPATIIFAADGTELIKRQGYLPPASMAALLEAVIADPTPGPSVAEAADVKPADGPVLTKAMRADLEQRSLQSYDVDNGGWGNGHKFIDTESMDLALMSAARGDADAIVSARKTFDGALNLIDPEWGGIYQYSDQDDWKSPHYEKIMWYQASGLRQYAAAYAFWGEPRYLAAAGGILRYLTAKLTSADGAFFTSQDADVDAALPGKMFYALTAAQRQSLGREPRIDTNIYARENGWAISALTAYYSATGDATVLARAEKAANRIVEIRGNSDGGFRHGERDVSGPYLGDTLAMGQAALDLYAATGKRSWLSAAGRAGAYIAANFKDADGGFKTVLKPEASLGVFLKAFKPLDEQVQATRFANMLFRYLGNEDYRALAEHGARYLGARVILDMPRPLPGHLLVDTELSSDPAHITIVGHKDDVVAQQLHASGRAYPALYKRLDWWDTREGPLPNADVQYPELDQAAAFVCTNRVCSLPAFTQDEIAATMRTLIGPKSARAANTDHRGTQ